MPFGIVGRTGPRMRQVVWFGIGPREGVFGGANLGCTIVTNGDFTAYVCDSTATRPSSQISLGRLVIIVAAHVRLLAEFFRQSEILFLCIYTVCHCCLLEWRINVLARDAFVRTNRRAIAMMFVSPSVWDGHAS